MVNHLLGRTGLKVYPVGLGTVEIGLPYGIGEQALPSDKEAERILKTAVELGVNYIDTARGYGMAEERIGKFGISRLPGVVIGTKCAQFLEKGEDLRGMELEKRIRMEVEESLKKLKVETLSLLQLHGGNKEQIERGELIDIVRRLMEEEKVQHAGICTRSEDAAMAAINSGFFETVQTAYSILDQRMAADLLPYAKDQNVGIINRSVLLKGALTTAVWQLPPEFDPLKENSAKAAAVAKKISLDLPTLAMRFVLSNPAVSVALIGTFQPQHLRAAKTAADAGPLSDKVLQQLYTLAISDPRLVDPSKWQS